MSAPHPRGRPHGRPNRARGGRSANNPSRRTPTGRSSVSSALSGPDKVALPHGGARDARSARADVPGAAMNPRHTLALVIDPAQTLARRLAAAASITAAAPGAGFADPVRALVPAVFEQLSCVVAMDAEDPRLRAACARCLGVLAGTLGLDAHHLSVIYDFVFD